jgi:His-Xaa-Ser system radical SAM maturase HxsB
MPNSQGLLSRRFLPVEHFTKEGPYTVLPFRFLALGKDREVLTNDWGEWLLAPRGTSARLVQRAIAPAEPLYRQLRGKQFLNDGGSSGLLDLAATKLRSKKGSLDGFTKLHMFVVTLRCEHTCHYCQVSRQTEDKVRYDMSPETAIRCLDLMMSSPSPYYTLEFQGGESFLAFDLMRFIVGEAKERAARLGKTINYVACTNLAVATDDQLRWCREEGVSISTSLDGPAFIHNANRPRPGGDSYEKTIDGIHRARDIVGFENVSALLTTTTLSLKHPIEIVDEYVKQGFRSIFLRPISPYGFAVRPRRNWTKYGMEEFLTFYKTALSHIIWLNRSGVDLAEVYAKILLTKLITPFPTRYVDLDSPSGAAISAVIYNYDGDVYAADEGRMLAEMGDKTFRMGNAHLDDYRAIFRNETVAGLLAAGTAEGLPGCSECAVQPFCGADPIFHHKTQGDPIGHRPTSDFCLKNMTIIKHLLGLLDSGDQEIENIFFAWIRGKSLREIPYEVSG